MPYHLLSGRAWTSTAHKQISGWALMIKSIRKLIMSCQASTCYQYLPAFLSVSQTCAQITCHLNVDGRISGLLFLGCFWKLSFRASQRVLHIFDNGHIFHQKIYSNCYLNTHTHTAISDLETKLWGMSDSLRASRSTNWSISCLCQYYYRAQRLRSP